MLSISKPPSKTKVVVAMSGGVDSSTVAAMLHREGYQVIGVTLQLYDYGLTVGKTGTCCAGQDIYDAKTVAEKFGFPHYVLDYESVFKQEVMDDFADSYLRGETPIPCVKCNQSVKFRDLYKVAKDLGADALATGHYVRRIDNTGAEMHMALDKTKDQTYFLFATTQQQLDYLHFPLGGMTKAETRKIAEEMGIPIHNKPDSQDICFVPNGDYASIVQKLRPGAIDPGEIVHIETGEILGKHEGIINFTIGQRRGIGIGGMGDPIYVVKIEPETRRVYVGPESALASTTFKIKDVNWLINKPEKPLDVEVKVRSAMAPVAARVAANGSTAEVTLFTPHKAVTPGQACVMYDSERVLGGGWITQA